MPSAIHGYALSNAGQQTDFIYLARSPSWWMDQAEKLKKSADVLLVEIERLEFNGHVDVGQIGDVYTHLAGLCIENLLKGLIMHVHPECVRPNGTLAKRLRIHDLSRLAAMAKLDADLKGDEREMIESAAEAISYWGRYGIPQHSAQLKYQWGWDNCHFAAFNNLYRRWAETLMRCSPSRRYVTRFPGETEWVELSVDEYICWRLDQIKPVTRTIAEGMPVGCHQWHGRVVKTNALVRRKGLWRLGSGIGNLRQLFRSQQTK